VWHLDKLASIEPLRDCYEIFLLVLDLNHVLIILLQHKMKIPLLSLLNRNPQTLNVEYVYAVELTRTAYLLVPTNTDTSQTNSIQNTLLSTLHLLRNFHPQPPCIRFQTSLLVVDPHTVFLLSAYSISLKQYPFLLIISLPITIDTFIC
jgi:hypothetical protein